jgi:hypothetical protein
MSDIRDRDHAAAARSYYDAFKAAEARVAAPAELAKQEAVMVAADRPCGRRSVRAAVSG